ncbi:MAG: hypothetical protein V5A46_08995 [Haloferacaceae archaeon]
MDDSDFDPEKTQFKFDPESEDGDEEESPKVRVQSIEDHFRELYEVDIG